MMEALGDDPAVSVESLVTEDSIVKALREVLPSMNADTATLKAVMQKLAVRFGMNFADLKAQWRPRIKALLPDLLELCTGGDASEAEGDKGEPETREEEEEEEEEVDLRPRRKRTERTTKQRNAIMDASEGENEEDDANESDASEDDACKPEEDDEDEDDVAPVKKRRTFAALQSDSDRTKKRKSKDAAPAVKKPKLSKQSDPPGLASLKELGRAAGVLNPRLYRLLKGAASSEEAEEILRDRLHDAGIAFHGSYPTSRDISAAKRKHAKEKDLEGIDTSLIITGGRSRRGAAQPRISYKEERISGEEDNDDEEDDEDAEEEEEEDDNENDASAASDSGESEASF
ncbi:60S ribosomal protein L17-1 [Phytophthora cinnamomi]|uniref:60S ribosomal protein L17-1 n=1 Tax=Phytophthora cinnamomi TaxID=4785 RepID=UPI0035594802|nr:60S ribosomal protein L17-1 [Phytophthora cinnamomi]